MTKPKVTKRSVWLQDEGSGIGKKTSVTLEDLFWQGLKDIAGARQISLAELINELSAGRQDAANFSSRLRLFVLDYYIVLARERGDALAKHEPEPQAPYTPEPQP